jgi:hypothetical protein
MRCKSKLIRLLNVRLVALSSGNNFPISPYRTINPSIDARRQKLGSHGFAAPSHHPIEVSVVRGPDEFEKGSIDARIYKPPQSHEFLRDQRGQAWAIQAWSTPPNDCQTNQRADQQNACTRLWHAGHIARCELVVVPQKKIQAVHDSIRIEIAAAPRGR